VKDSFEEGQAPYLLLLQYIDAQMY